MTKPKKQDRRLFCLADKSDYDKARREQAKKARAEFLEYVVVKDGPHSYAVARLINYMVERMAFNTVITDQMANWIFGHMSTFARLEVQRDRRRSGKGRP